MSLLGNTIIIVDHNEGTADWLRRAVVDSTLFTAMNALCFDCWRVEEALDLTMFHRLMKQNFGRNVLLLTHRSLDNDPDKWPPGCKGERLFANAAALLAPPAPNIAVVEDIEIRGLIYSIDPAIAEVRRSFQGGMLHTFATNRTQSPPFWSGHGAVIAKGYRSVQPELWTIGWLLTQYYIGARLMKKLINALLGFVQNPGYSYMMELALKEGNDYLALRFPNDARNPLEHIYKIVAFLSQYASFFKLYPGQFVNSDNEWLDMFSEETNTLPPIRLWLEASEPIYSSNTLLKEAATGILTELETTGVC